MVTGMACAASYEEGKHYKRVDQPKIVDADKVEVLEFFWYGCPHCYSFEPHISKWKKNKPDNVEFVQIPATFRPQWVLHARAYYALEMLGVGDKIHPKFFSEMHVKKNNLKTVDALIKFVEQHGVDRSEFVDAMNSFAVETKVRKANKLVEGYKLGGVPSVTVNGKYLVSASMAGSYENMIKIMNYLVERESAKAGLDTGKTQHGNS